MNRIPYDYAHLLCKRTAWHIRKELIPIFGQQFPLEALHPDHADYGCLLLDPLTRKKNSLHKRNTMRAAKPYSKPLKKKTPTIVKKVAGSRVASSMSVTRLLNNEDSDILSSEEEEDDDDTSSSFSSPSFRVVQTYPPEDWSPVLAPMHSPSPPPPQAHIAQDIIDTISATILLQRLSQDDGKRPFKPLEATHIPSKVIVGHQEFSICWD